MRSKIPGSRRMIGRRILVLEIVAFLLIIAIAWITTIFDPPYIFTNQSGAYSVSIKPVDIYETAFETIVIVLIASFIVPMTVKLIGRIKYLEGFMTICASCKKIKIDGHWVQIEKVISDQSNLRFSHGICPGCAEELYKEVYQRN